MTFFKYNQNNSGGSFDEDENLTRLVIIEAENQDKADDKAQSLGIYFNGVDEGRDCECCGDRWYEGEELIFPMVWSSSEPKLTTLDAYIEKMSYGKDFMGLKYNAIIHHANGEIERIE